MKESIDVAAAREYPDLEVGEYLNAQRVEWRVQRIGWALMLLVMIGGALGLLGRGVWSNRTVRSPDGVLRVTHARFTRLEAPAELRLSVTSSHADRPVRIWISRAFLAEHRIERIAPPPMNVHLTTDRFVYEFSRARGDAELLIVFHMQAQTPGAIAGRAGVVDGPQVRFESFVWP